MANRPGLALLAIGGAVGSLWLISKIDSPDERTDAERQADRVGRRARRSARKVDRIRV